MNGVDAVIAVSQLLGLAISLLVRAQEVSALVERAQAEGRDLTAEEMAQIVAAREAARAAAAAAIAP